MLVFKPPTAVRHSSPRDPLLLRPCHCSSCFQYMHRPQGSSLRAPLHSLFDYSEDIQLPPWSDRFWRPACVFLALRLHLRFQDPFIVFSSNLFAIMGLRSVYVIIAQLVSQLPYLKPAVALVLGFVGCKMLLEYVHIKISTGWSLLVVLSLISGGVTLSLVARRRKTPVVRHKRRHSGNTLLPSQNGGGGGEGESSGFV